MKNKLFLEKSLELIVLGEQLLAEAKDKHEVRELQGAIKVQKQILRNTGYREPREKRDFKPDANIFRDAKAKVEAERNPKIVEAIKEDVAGKPTSQKDLDKAHAKMVKKLKSGKKVNTTDKEKAQIQALYKAQQSITEISEVMWVVEESIYKILGIEGGNSKAVLADNSENEGLNG